MLTKDELRARYPELFENVYCGFSCGDGWNHLIDRVCRYVKHWAIPFRFAQIKEKFGTLRLYYDIDYRWDVPKHCDIVHVVDMAEHASWFICEDCGSMDDVTTEGCWIRTMCGACRAIYNQPRGGS